MGMGTDNFDCEKQLVGTAKEEGVVVVVPQQESGVEVEIVKLPLGTLEDLRSGDDDFTPTRLVINFEVKDAQTGNLLYTFDPAIKLQVAYAAEDVKNAGGELDNLILGFWLEAQERLDEKGGRWIAFTKEKHEFRLRPCDPDHPEWGGFGFAWVSNWDDAHIGWGH
jgi:hypothetical protein